MGSMKNSALPYFSLPSRRQRDCRRGKGAGRARLIVDAHIQIYQMLAVFFVLSIHCAINSVGVAYQIGMADLGHKLSQRAIIAHPVRRVLHQPADALGAIVELTRHASLALDRVSIEALQ